MKLQRENFYGSDVAGDWYSADDVDALLASIREAVAAEREAALEEKERYTMWHICVTKYGMKDPRSSPEDVNRAEQEAREVRKNLDKLLSGEA